MPTPVTGYLPPELNRAIDEFYSRIPSGGSGSILPEEAKFLANVILKEKTDNIFELGVASGASTAVMQLVCMHTPELANTIITSYDFARAWYVDPSKPVNWYCDELLDKQSPNFKLFLTRDEEPQAYERLASKKGKKLIFIDAMHIHPYPLIDTLKVLPYLNSGDWLTYHDSDLAITLGYKCGDGASYIHEACPDELWHTNDDARNIGGFVFKDQKTTLRMLEKMAYYPYQMWGKREVAPHDQVILDKWKLSWKPEKEMTPPTPKSTQAAAEAPIVVKAPKPKSAWVRFRNWILRRN